MCVLIIWPPDETTWCSSAPALLFSFKQQQRATERGQVCFQLTCQVDLLSPPLAQTHVQPPIAVLWQAKEDFTRKWCQARHLIGWTLKAPAKETDRLQKSPQVNVWIRKMKEWMIAFEEFVLASPSCLEPLFCFYLENTMGSFSVEIIADLISLAEASVGKQGGFVLHVVKRTLLAGDFRKLFLTLWYPGTQLKLISQRKCSKDIESQKVLWLLSPFQLQWLIPWRIIATS